MWLHTGQICAMSCKVRSRPAPAVADCGLVGAGPTRARHDRRHAPDRTQDHRPEDRPELSRLLIIDDDAALCRMLADYLGAEGYEVDTVQDGDSGLEAAASGDYDLVLLDVMLPGRSGFDVLRSLRPRTDTPVLMLTARGDDVDRIVGLEMGADDYVPKPCNPREITARIHAILRRSGGGTARGESVQVGDLTLSPSERSLRRGGEEVVLTGAEFDLLAVLLASAGEVVARERLSEEALGRPLTRYDRSLDMHMSNLRRKLGPAADGGNRIQAVRGKGYIYRVSGAGGD